MSYQQPTCTSYYYPPQQHRHGHGASQSTARAPRRHSGSQNIPLDAYTGEPREYGRDGSFIPGGVYPLRNRSGGEPQRKNTSRPLDSLYSRKDNDLLDRDIESKLGALRSSSSKPSSRRTSSHPHPPHREKPHTSQGRPYKSHSQNAQPNRSDYYYSQQSGHQSSANPEPVIEEPYEEEEEIPRMKLLTYPRSRGTPSLQGSHSNRK
jgi:hypothetical protein